MLDDGWAVLSGAQLDARGWTRQRRRVAAASGQLQRVGRDLYLLGSRRSGEAGWNQDLAVACARRPGAAICGATAAALHRLDGFEPGEPIRLVVAHRSSGRDPSVRRRRDLAGVVQVDGLPVTNIEHTLIDLGADLSARPGCAGGSVIDPIELVELALEDALRRQLTHLDALRDAMGSVAANRPGLTMLKQVLAQRPPTTVPTGSYLETRCVQVLRRGAVADFDRQVAIHDDEGLIGIVDLVRGGVAIEVVGKRWHLERFTSDHARYARLTAAGYLFLPFTFADIEWRPHHVVSTTKETMHRAGEPR